MLLFVIANTMVVVRMFGLRFIADIVVVCKMLDDLHPHARILNPQTDYCLIDVTSSGHFFSPDVLNVPSDLLVRIVGSKKEPFTD